MVTAISCQEIEGLCLPQSDDLKRHRARLTENPRGGDHPDRAPGLVRGYRPGRKEVPCDGEDRRLMIGG